MRPIHQLVHARTRVEPRYALMPLEGFPASRLPTWPTATVKILASPRIGAEFVMYLIDLPAGDCGEFAADLHIESFWYVLDGTGAGYGTGTGTDTSASLGPLLPGNFGLTPPGRPLSLKATSPLRLLVLRKRYEPIGDHPRWQGLYGHETGVKENVWADDPGSLLQQLVPDDLAFDLAMNLFTFQPGHGLPVVETHVMEHGALMLEGKGLYYLGDRWLEVEAGDFIYMAPFCPQSFYATGDKPAKYIYYKNVNRDIAL